MNDLLNYPRLIFVLAFLMLSLSTLIGVSFRRRRRKLEQEVREDFGTVLAATLTLSGLIIGFTFQMSISRYEQRKNYEAAEANAIGTEYVRADLLSTADAATVRSLLRLYVDERVSFYTAQDERQIRQINDRTALLQTELWAAVRGAGATQPTAVAALAIAGMNDVLNSQAYTQAAWWNRIPASAWLLMAAIAMISHFLVGYGAQNTKAERFLLTVLPFVVSISFLLIADIDSPRSGIIRVNPQNLTSLIEPLRAH
jgi:hypothetical protein